MRYANGNKIQIKLNFTNGALKAISETALKKQIGARGLRSVLVGIRK